MPVTDDALIRELSAYLAHRPGEACPLSEARSLLVRGRDVASRHTYPMHVTAGALLTRGAEILLVEHRAYGLLLQPGGHLDPADPTLPDAALRELTEETGIDPAAVTLRSPMPAYVEFGRVPARPEKNEPAHCHLDFGYVFATETADLGRLQDSEIRNAAWYPIAEAEALVGARIARAR